MDVKKSPNTNMVRHGINSFTTTTLVLISNKITFPFLLLNTFSKSLALKICRRIQNFLWHFNFEAFNFLIRDLRFISDVNLKKDKSYSFYKLNETKNKASEYFARLESICKVHNCRNSNQSTLITRALHI